MKVIIMAGGMGTRIQSVRADVPKPMIEICGKPILQYQIENLKACGLTDITIGVGHLGHVIKGYFGDGSKFGVNISYFTGLTTLQKLRVVILNAGLKTINEVLKERGLEPKPWGDKWYRSSTLIPEN